MKPIQPIRSAGYLLSAAAGIMALGGAAAATENTISVPAVIEATYTPPRRAPAPPPPLHEATRTNEKEVRGLATLYGTPSDRFGYVQTTDERVQNMLLANGYDPATLAEYIIAPQYLRRPQIDSLYRENPDKYRLITRDGSAYNPLQPTIAMADSLLGKRVLVANPRTGKSIEVRVTDTGAFDDAVWARKRGVPRRIADLSKGAADAIGHNGLEDVIITIRN